MSQKDTVTSDPVAASTRTSILNLSSDNLPLQLTSFVGREAEIAEAKGLLVDHRLVTLVGPGGCGKTRLALAVAFEVAERFEDGVWWVGLASLSDPDLVPQVVASALDVREMPGRSFTRSIAERLGRGKTLLVLDNCEHLIDACAALADALLRECPDLRVLTTSREALGVAGEIPWPVPPLSLPDNASHPADTGTLRRYEAVRLFEERARASVPTFTLNQKNSPAAARLCRRLDGMPLAIELAAVRVKVLSVEQILERLDDCFRLLKTDGRMAVARHQTLRATMDWSHGLLPEEEKVLFRRFSVFAGGFTLRMAERVCAGEGVEKEDMLDLLTHLVDKSLVLVEEHDSEPRYRMLETVRQYAREKLHQAGEGPKVRDLHAGFFLELAVEAEPALLGPEQLAWLKRLDRELDNLRAALGWLKEGNKTKQGLELAGALWRFWWLRGYFAEGQTQLQALLALPDAGGLDVERAKALYTLGVLTFRRADHEAGDMAEARAYQQESLEIYRALGDRQRTAGALRELGRINIELPAWEAARAFLQESLELEKELGNAHGYALSLSSLGWLAHFRRENAIALPLIDESLAIFRKLGDMLYVSICLFFQGRIATDFGDYATAHARLEEATKAASGGTSFRGSAARVLDAFARLAAAQGQAARALRLAGAAAGLREAIGAAESPVWAVDVDRKLQPAWRQLGEKAGMAAWNEGREMTLEQALAYALEQPAPPKEVVEDVPPSSKGPADTLSKPPPKPYPAGLTAREAEVLGLLAGGKTNKEIARELVLSVSTVERHVANIYAKIGAHNRAAATAYAFRQGIAEPHQQRELGS